MKYLKAYEEIKNEPEIGDYVIIKSRYSNRDPNDDKRHQNTFNDFVNNNIGIVQGYNKSMSMIVIRYEVVPDIILNWFILDSFCKDFNKNGLYLRSFVLEEIVNYSNNKEELELLIASNKYNI